MSDDAPKLDLTKKRERRRLGPDGEYITNREHIIPSPAYDPRELKDVLKSNRELVKHKAKERFQSMGERTLPTGFPTTQFQFDRAVIQKDIEAIKFLIKHWMEESNGLMSSGMWLTKHGSIEFTFPPDSRTFTHRVMLVIDKQSELDGFDIVSALSNPGSVQWNSLDVILPEHGLGDMDEMHFQIDFGEVADRVEGVLAAKGSATAISMVKRDVEPDAFHDRYRFAMNVPLYVVNRLRSIEFDTGKSRVKKVKGRSTVFTSKQWADHITQVYEMK